MPGEKLRIGPTHALRLVLAKRGSASLGQLLQDLDQEGVSLTRATRAIRRALDHGQIGQDARGHFYLSRRPDTW